MGRGLEAMTDARLPPRTALDAVFQALDNALQRGPCQREDLRVAIEDHPALGAGCKVLSADLWSPDRRHLGADSEDVIDAFLRRYKRAGLIVLEGSRRTGRWRLLERPRHPGPPPCRRRAPPPAPLFECDP